MPEALFLIMAFATLYFVCRVLFAPELRARAVPLAVKFTAAAGPGFRLPAFLPLPPSEFPRIARRVHPPSNLGGIRGPLGPDWAYRRPLQSLLPLLAGPVLGSIFSAGPL